MPQHHDDETLTGGNSTAVARRGSAVHRTAGPWTPTIHRLLDHLHSRGIDFLPRPLGIDERGREMLTYLPGAVPSYPFPGYVWTPTVLRTAGQQLAAIHAASRSFLTVPSEASGDESPEAVWQLPTVRPVEVICLNDVAPYNMVFGQAGDLIGWIDVDTASPGPRAWDLAYLAYRLVPLTGAETSGAGTPDVLRYRQRLADLCRAYARGGDSVTVTPAEVLSLLPRRLLALAVDAESRLASGAEHLAGHGDFYRSEVAWLDERLVELAELA